MFDWKNDEEWRTANSKLCKIKSVLSLLQVFLIQCSFLFPSSVPKQRPYTKSVIFKTGEVTSTMPTKAREKNISKLVCIYI